MNRGIHLTVPTVPRLRISAEDTVQDRLRAMIANKNAEQAELRAGAAELTRQADDLGGLAELLRQALGE